LVDLCLEGDHLSALDVIIDYVQKFRSAQNFKLVQCIIPKIMLQMEDPTLAVKPLWLCNHDDDDLNLKYFDKPDIEIVKQLPAHYCKEEYFIAFTDRCKKDEKG